MFNRAYILCSHYLALFILSATIWALLWVAFGENWRWDGAWFRLGIVGIVAWASGEVLYMTTTLPPLLAALLTGILARYMGVLDMRQYTDIDVFLRKIYPVLILGKGSLTWDLRYMRDNWLQVSALGVLPWCAEVATVTAATHYLLNFPWLWGTLLGTFYASVSFAVVMPSVQRHASIPNRNWPQLILTAGGTDTALSVGVFGLLFSFMMSDADETHRYIKAGLTLFVGVALGAIWGCFGKLVPHASDFYVAEMRVLFLLTGGLLGNFCLSALNWGGAGGVAVLVCNSVAANLWVSDDWKLKSNPVVTAYKVMWSTFEPMVFAYTGTFFVMDASMADTLLIGFSILLISLTVRLAVTFLTCWDMTTKERLFVLCTWIPKSIVEAVLCPLAIDTLMATPEKTQELQYAESILRLTVQAILITTPIGFLLTDNLGGRLLKKEENDTEKGHKRKSTSESALT